MKSDTKAIYSAIKSRDERFDGRFFMAVLTTGIYCRPICPAPTPKLENVRIFPSAAAAQEAGFRPCLRCRPEASPAAPGWMNPSSVVATALRLISEGFLDESGVEHLAQGLSVSERHLRRLFMAHLGASPKGVALTRRIHLAKRLIDETTLSMTRIAICSGFSSVRRFNAIFKDVYGRSPSELRKQKRSTHAGEAEVQESLSLTLSYRPPFNWAPLADFFHFRAVDGLEEVTVDSYRRAIAVGEHLGTVTVRPLAGRRELSVTISSRLADGVGGIVDRIQRMFDLKADSTEVARHLAQDQVLAPLVRQRPAIRVPGSWDVFELAVRAILGQRISVRAAQTFCARLVKAYGTAFDGSGTGNNWYSFPSAARLEHAKLETLGIDASRARAIRALATEVRKDDKFLFAYKDLDEFVQRITELPGVGAWTAHYIAMRGLGEPDAFPASDLILRRAAGRGRELSATELLQMSEAWRPWRAYAAICLWSAYSEERNKEDEA